MRNRLQRLFLRTLGRFIPSDFFSYRFPVSVKGICTINDQVILVQNEEGEWDLPGGKLRTRESLKVCLQREFQEELGIQVHIEELASTQKIKVRRLFPIEVVIVVFRCHTAANKQELRISHENFSLDTFPVSKLPGINLPDYYQKLLREELGNSLSSATN